MMLMSWGWAQASAFCLVTEEVVTADTEADVRAAAEAIAGEGQLPEIALGGGGAASGQAGGRAPGPGPS